MHSDYIKDLHNCYSKQAMINNEKPYEVWQASLLNARKTSSHVTHVVGYVTYNGENK